MEFRTTHAGFSLVEAIVSIAVLAFAIAGPMTLASRTLNATVDSRSELIATHLAEEGIEIVRSVRDNDSADGAAWDYYIASGPGGGSCTTAPDGCIVDITNFDTGGVSQIWGNQALDKCNGACNGKIYINPATGLYRQVKGSLAAPWVLTPFTRNVLVTSVGSNQMRVVSTVTYTGYRGVVKTITVTDDLYNWFPGL